MRLLLLLLALVVCVPLGCRPAAPAQGSSQSQAAALAFSSTLAALEVLDELHYQRMHYGPDPTPEQAKWARAHFEKLERLRQALVIVRKWLSGDAAETDGHAAFRDAAELLQLLIDELRAQKLQVPKAVDAGLAAARVFY